MRPLLMVLKVFLQQRELNEVRCHPAAHSSQPTPQASAALGGVYVVKPPARWCMPSPAPHAPLPPTHTRNTHARSLPPHPRPQVYSGGLGSYALLVMVAAFLMLHPSRRPPPTAQRFGGSGSRGGGERGGGASAARELEGGRGVLLVDFLRLYGRALNQQEVCGGRVGGWVGVSLWGGVEVQTRCAVHPHRGAKQYSHSPAHAVIPCVLPGGRELPQGRIFLQQALQGLFPGGWVSGWVGGWV